MDELPLSRPLASYCSSTHRDLLLLCLSTSRERWPDERQSNKATGAWIYVWHKQTGSTTPTRLEHALMARHQQEGNAG